MPHHAKPQTLLQEGEEFLKSGKVKIALERLTQAYTKTPHDPYVLLALGKAHSVDGNKQEAESLFQRFLRDSPDWRGKRILYFKAMHSNRSHVKLEDLGFSDVQLKAKPIFISSMPRSGVNLLSGSIHHLTNFPFRYAYQEGDDDQQMDSRAFLDACNERTIVSHHTRCNNRTLSTMQAFEIRPIILINDIFESLASYVFHIDSHESPRTLASSWSDLTFEKKLDHVIELQTFWNLDFYASWIRARNMGLIDFKLLRFSDLAERLEEVIVELSEKYDWGKNPENIRSSLEFTNKHADALISQELEEALKWKSPPAITRFTNTQIARVRQISKLLTEIDLSPVGL